MSQENETVAVAEAPVETAVAETPKAKSKTPKKKVAPPVTPTADKGPRSLGDGSKTPAERRLIVVKAMRKLGAVGATSSVTAAILVEKTGLTPYDVYCLLYKHYPLQVGGFVKQVQVEGVRGLSYHLTAKGQKTDPT